MTSTLLTKNEISISAEAVQQAREFRRKGKDVSTLKFSLDLEDGTRQPVPEALSSLFQIVIDAVSSAGRVSFTSLPAEMTTAAAAGVLGISRPTLMKMLSRKELKFHKVGTHIRIKTKDLLKFKESRLARQKAAFAKLRDLSELIQNE